MLMTRKNLQKMSSKSPLNMRTASFYSTYVLLLGARTQDRFLVYTRTCHCCTFRRRITNRNKLCHLAITPLRFRNMPVRPAAVLPVDRRLATTTKAAGLRHPPLVQREIIDEHLSATLRRLPA